MAHQRSCVVSVLLMLIGTLAPTAADTVVPKEWLPVEHITHAILSYQAKCGNLPTGTNKEIVDELVRAGCLRSNVGKYFDSEGRILDSKGRPLVFFLSKEAGMVIASIDPETGIVRDYLFLEHTLSPPEVSEARVDAIRRLREQEEKMSDLAEQKAAQPGATDNPGDAQ